MLYQSEDTRKPSVHAQGSGRQALETGWYTNEIGTRGGRMSACNNILGYRAETDTPFVGSWHGTHSQYDAAHVSSQWGAVQPRRRRISYAYTT